MCATTGVTSDQGSDYAWGAVYGYPGVYELPMLPARVCVRIDTLSVYAFVEWMRRVRRRYPYRAASGMGKLASDGCGQAACGDKGCFNSKLMRIVS